MTSSGDGQDFDSNFGDSNNVVTFKRPAKGKDKKPSPAPKPPKEPLFNLPPYTQYFLLLLVTPFLIVTFLLNDEQAHWVFIHLGFIPGRFTGDALFEPLALITPLSHLFLHGSWLHIAMNGLMLLAFGSGIERWLGGRKMIFLFFGCGLFGVTAHFILNMHSIYPVIGASGGLSGLFAVALIMINRQNGGMTGKYGIWPFVLLWVGISIVFGFIGSPDGSQIAWAAHVGGFLGGFAMAKLMKI